MNFMLPNNADDINKMIFRLTSQHDFANADCDAVAARSGPSIVAG